MSDVLRELAELSQDMGLYSDASNPLVLSDELPEMIQRASEVDDPTVFRLCDVAIRHRLRQAKRAKIKVGI